MTSKEDFCREIKRHEGAMYALAHTIVKNDSDACEIISEAIYRAYAALDSLKDDKAFKSWILSIVHNVAVEYIRKNTKVIPLEEVNLVDDKSEESLNTKLTIRNAVDSLSQSYRTVVVLYYYEDLSISQISKITGKTTVTVKQQLSRGRKQLREILKEDFRND